MGHVVGVCSSYRRLSDQKVKIALESGEEDQLFPVNTYSSGSVNVVIDGPVEDAVVLKRGVDR